MTQKLFKLTFALFASTAILASCGSDSDDDGIDIDPSELEGLWAAQFCPGDENLDIDDGECDPDWTHVHFYVEDDEGVADFYYLSEIPNKLGQYECLELSREPQESWELDGEELTLSDSIEEEDNEFEVDFEDEVLTLSSDDGDFSLEFIQDGVDEEDLCPVFDIE